MLDIDREVVDCSFLADGRLRFVLGARNEGERDHHEGVLLPRDAPIRVNAMAMRQLTVEETDDLQRRDEPV
jgi:hypothetical protein